MYKKTQNAQNTSNDKNKYWAHNKNVTNDEVVDVKAIHTGPIITLRGPNTSNNPPHAPNQTTNTLQNTQEQKSQRKFPARRKYTPLGEPIELVLKQLLQQKAI